MCIKIYAMQRCAASPLLQSRIGRPWPATPVCPPASANLQGNIMMRRFPSRSCESGEREHDARNAPVVRCPRVPLQQVGCDDRPLVCGDRGGREAAGSGRHVTGGMDARVFVMLWRNSFTRTPPSGSASMSAASRSCPFCVGDAPAAVDDEASFDRFRPLLRVHPQSGATNRTGAIKFGLTIEDLTSTFHPYLTLSEGIKLAAQTLTKDVARLSCCARGGRTVSGPRTPQGVLPLPVEPE